MVVSEIKLICNNEAQLSVAKGTAAKAAEIAVTSEHSKVTFKLPTAEVIVGAIVSLILIVCVAVVAFPQTSVMV